MGQLGAFFLARRLDSDSAPWIFGSECDQATLSGPAGLHRDGVPV